MKHGQMTQTVGDIMQGQPVTVSSSASLPDAYWLMLENSIRRLLVVDDGRLVGIVTMEDLRGAIRLEIIAIHPIRATTILAELPVSHLMSKEPVTIAPGASILAAAQLMIERKISTLPVVDGDAVVGIITESDLFRVLVDCCQPKGAPAGGRDGGT